MVKTTTEQTIEYIKDHPDIKSCLKKGILNYSSLSRLISSELNIEKKTSKEAILIAARRFKEALKGELIQEKKIKDLLTQSEIEIKNKIVVFILDKTINFEQLSEIHKKARAEFGAFYIIEGSDSYTLITQDKYAASINTKFKSKILNATQELALVNIKTPESVEQITGVIAYMTSLFSERGVNIVELLSCWKDNLFVISAKDVNKAIEFLKF